MKLCLISRTDKATSCKQTKHHLSNFRSGIEITDLSRILLAVQTLNSNVKLSRLLFSKKKATSFSVSNVIKAKKLNVCEKSRLAHLSCLMVRSI